MRKSKFEKLIKNSFEHETPNFLSQIKEECRKTKQVEPIQVEEKRRFNFPLFFKRMALGLACCLLFISGIVVGNITNKNNGGNTPTVLPKACCVYLDVNPSIEIQLDENKYVLDCLAGNEDGEKILGNISLKGVEINTALYAIVGSMCSKGYLNTESNSILVSVENYKEEESIVLTDITTQIDNIFKDNDNMDCSVIAQNVTSNTELENKADDHKVSIGKMTLVEKIISSSDIYDEEDVGELVSMSIHELDLLFKFNKEDKKDEVVSGKPNGYLKHEEIINSVLEHLEKTSNQIDKYDINTLYYYENNERKIAYLVSIEFTGEHDKKKIVIDSSSGEIKSESVLDKWKDKISYDGSFVGPNDDHDDNNDKKGK